MTTYILSALGTGNYREALYQLPGRSLPVKTGYFAVGSAPENPSSGFKRLSHFQKFSPGIAIPQGRMRPNSVVPGAEFSA